MKLYEIGRVCVKTMGRETGKHCVVVAPQDNRYVVVTGPKKLNGVRRRRCNIGHLEPLELKVEIPEDADDEAVFKAIEQAGLLDRFRKRIHLVD